MNKAGEKVVYDLENKINQAVFPGLQGGPHNNAIAGIATALRQAMTPEFRNYQEQVLSLVQFVTDIVLCVYKCLWVELKTLYYIIS